MLLQDLGIQRRSHGDMTAASQRLDIALITMAQRGERPRCADPVDHIRWTSDDQRNRQIAVAWCAGCPVIVECGQAADARDERWHVWGGVDYTRRQRAA
jgi:Transcription factor WhiB